MAENLQTQDLNGIPGLVEYWNQRRIRLRGLSITSSAGARSATLTVRAAEQPSVSETTHAFISSPESMKAIPDGEVVIQSAIIGFDHSQAGDYMVRTVAIPWIEIITGLQKDPHFLNSISPRRLEELVAEAYVREGYTDVELTPYSGDLGRDVIVSATVPGIGTIKIVDQVKRYAPRYRVKANDVRALLGVLLRDQNVSKGIVTTTADFAPRIHDEIKNLFPTRLELKNGTALNRWLLKLQSRGGNE
jgi:restriction system protein